MQKYSVQLRERGIVTLPKAVRQRYGLAPNTPLTLVDWNGTLVLSSHIPVVTELAKQVGTHSGWPVDTRPIDRMGPRALRD